MHGLCPPDLRRIVATGLCAATLLIATAAVASAWQTAHGNPDNSNSADVRTAPAVKPTASVPLRDIAPSVAPVIAPNGTLYIGDTRGKLMSFAADGTPGWSRDLGGFQSVRASPAIGSDGSVYVVGLAKVRDNTSNPPKTRYVAELHRFTAGGGWLWHVPLAGPIEGIVSSAPTVVRHEGSDVVLVATGQQHTGFEAYLTAFSAETGAVLAHQKVSVFTSPDVTGGPDWGDLWPDWLDMSFSVDLDPEPKEGKLPKGLTRPFPALALYTQADNGIPRVFITDRYHDFVSYGFTGSSFTELFRVADTHHYITTAALVWPNGPVMVGGFTSEEASEVTFVSLSSAYDGGPASIHRTFVYSFLATPTSLGNSRFAISNLNGGVTFLNGAAHEKWVDLPGQSIAAPAASRNHVFVSTVTGLYTFNKATREKASEFAWDKGGVSQPVIGPQGHVYAIAQNTLYVFPPSRIPELPDVGSLPNITSTNPQPLPPPSGVLADTGLPNPQSPPEIQPADTQSLPEIQQDLPSKSYDPPMTAGGNRLFACLNLDGDDCGNSHHREVAEAFCRKQGFERAEDIDVDSRRGNAETLEGHFCSKKKCKVFDRIVCRK